MTTPYRVAILGGGLGAMTAAHTLTDPSLQGRFDVTVYQMGWRLGGKAATGRDASHHDRIEEHGLHMLMGWYEKLFGVMRQTYAEWDAGPGYPLSTIDEAFIPQRSVALSENLALPHDPPDWVMWNIHFPKLPGEPGEPTEPSDRDHPLTYLRELMSAILIPAKKLGLDLTAGHADNQSSWKGHAITQAMTTQHEPQHTLGLLSELEKILHWLETEIGKEIDKVAGELRQAWILLQLGLAFAKGLLFDVLPHGADGWDKINHLDLKDWLESHGAATPEVSFSAPIRAFYDLTFAYENGDTSSYKHAKVAAGVAAKVMLRIAFTYKNAPFFKMASAMGDIIMTPLYEVLRARGVRFEFFSKVQAIHPTADGNDVQSVDIIPQAIVPAGEYLPLYPAGGMRTWPSEPHWSQLKDGTTLKAEGVNFESAWCDTAAGPAYTIENGTDFDAVVLGISLGALPRVAPELGQANSDWQAMYDGMPTTQTQAAQLWTGPDLAGLGWADGPMVVSAWLQPMASGLADMSQTLATEEWPVPGPGAVEYLCAPMVQTNSDPYADPDYPEQQLAMAKKNTYEWLQVAAERIFPNTAGPDGFRWDMLYGKGEGTERFDDQYFRVNVDPTERYVLTLPGTVHLRRDPADSGFANLFPAGDWVKTSVNGGSAEAAAEGGVLAGQAMIAKYR